LAQVEVGDALVTGGIVVVRRGMMPIGDIQERVVQRPEIAREKKRRNPRLVGLERDGDDVAHQAGMLAKVFG
jgi:hypothetical protein